MIQSYGLNFSLIELLELIMLHNPRKPKTKSKLAYGFFPTADFWGYQSLSLSLKTYVRPEVYAMDLSGNIKENKVALNLIGSSYPILIKGPTVLSLILTRVALCQL